MIFQEQPVSSATASLNRKITTGDWRWKLQKSELVQLDFVDIAAVLGIRMAVHAGSLALPVVKNPSSRRDFHAALRKSLPNQPLRNLALLAALPLGPGKSTGWVGPEEYGLKTLPLSVTFGLRIDFEHEDGQWRIDYFPAMRASARENEAIGGIGSKADFLAWKRYFNTVMASENADLQTAMWQPLSNE